MTEIEFRALAAQGYNRIPLLAECLSDLDTPLSLYVKLIDRHKRGNSFLLESVVGGERFGRYSFIGLPARQLVRARGDLIEVVRDGEVIEATQGDPLNFVRDFQKRFKVALRPGLPRFCGGLAGYFAYDVVRFIEPRLGPSTKPDPIGTPDILMMVVDELAIVDNLRGKLYLIVYADPSQPDAYSQARRRLRGLQARLAQPAFEPEDAPLPQSDIRREFDRTDYLAAVARAKEYIVAGDVMQVQIGQCLRKPYAHSPLSLYRALRSINPSPYMYYYDFDGFQVIGASPEILVRQESHETVDAAGAVTAHDTKVTIRPIAGTRRRGLTEAQDAALAAELLADPKERAEHLMLIDLARNDIGRIAQVGTVKVTDQMIIEKYSHVQHIVSSVEGRLKPGMTNMDVLRATFPAGTLSGAPKVRAMEIIDELEPVKRGIYGGAVGYLSFAGDMDVAIAIRTGVVADSDPDAEWRETEHKARAVLRAAEQVQDGLDADFY